MMTLAEYRPWLRRALLLAAFFAARPPIDAQTCLECHGQSDFVVEGDRGERSLYVDEGIYSRSVHGDFACRDCHVDAVGDPHPEKLAAVHCAACHEEAAADLRQGVHGRDGDCRAPTCSTCHTAHAIRSAADSASSTHAMNLPKTCGACHLENSGQRDAAPIERAVERYNLGVHGQALADGNDAAPSCSACHEPHRTLPRSDPLSPIYRANISATCGRCHDHIAAEYHASVHGVGLQQGEFMSATCITCHDAHQILSPSDPDSPSHPLNAPDKLCAPCHDSEPLTRRVGIEGKAFQSYKDSYHGLAAAGGSSVAATCASCHGVHQIRSKADPQSLVHPDNVRKTCARCHPYADEKFARAYSHADVNAPGRKISAVVRSVYIVLIVVIIGVMAIHNLIIWTAHVRLKLRRLKRSPQLRRFDTAWVIQHIVVIVTFAVLAITGFALKHPQALWVKCLVSLGMTEAVRGGLHRVAAVGLLAAGLFHLYCLFFRPSWRGELRALAPRSQDFKQFVENLRHHLFLRRPAPRFGRYGYIEKVEYWALVWGTVAMAVTGSILWFPAFSSRYLPTWAVQVAETIHYYEAVLAVAAVLVFHFFFVIFHPQQVPIDLTGFTGMISEEDARHKHPEWYDELKNAESLE